MHCILKKILEELRQCIFLGTVRDSPRAPLSGFSPKKTERCEENCMSSTFLFSSASCEPFVQFRAHIIRTPHVKQKLLPSIRNFHVSHQFWRYRVSTSMSLNCTGIDHLILKSFCSTRTSSCCFLRELPEASLADGNFVPLCYQILPIILTESSPNALLHQNLFLLDRNVVISLRTFEIAVLWQSLEQQRNNFPLSFSDGNCALSVAYCFFWTLTLLVARVSSVQDCPILLDTVPYFQLLFLSSDLC